MPDIDTWLKAALASTNPYETLQVAADDLEEQGNETAANYLRGDDSVIRPDWKEGDTILVETQTLYYVGLVSEVGLGWTKLEDCSWVHWTGRLSTLHRLRKFTGSAFGTRVPRTEYVGTKYIYHDALVSHSPGPWELPKEQV